MTKFFFKLKKSYFWPFLAHFPYFWAKKSFSTKLSWVSGTMPKFREIQRPNFKKTPWQVPGGKDGQTLFHRIIPATAMGLTSKTAKNCHLKVKYIEYHVGLTKSYGITVSTEKISLIYKLIQQILGSHELNGHAQFWPHLPQNHWNYF